MYRENWGVFLFISFGLIFFSLSLGVLKEGEIKKSRRGKKEVTGGGFFGETHWRE